ncbi:hypothetical protein SEPL_230 [Salmonella phage SE_PL]|nr:hypothetical protein CPT_Munch_195 [Salmonella phage Munch]QCW18881.1 hypothetical protein 7t3_0360 [Salmonella phage 7t3]QIG62843.1 hypothetical protein SEPL_230 [Salmonella phage SE_PL]WNV47303.1 hypothetical protein [Klebsiella phage fENko-Kae01]
MYTVLFTREAGGETEEYYGTSPSVFEVHYFNTEYEVKNYIVTETAYQEKIAHNDTVYNKRRFYYGTYSYAVLLDGVLISNDYNFDCCFSEVTLPDGDYYFNVYDLCVQGVKQFDEYKNYLFKYINEEETAYKRALKKETEERLLKEKEREEKEKLKELLKKYPDIR